MKTVIEYDCMPTYANILAASIIDMGENRVVKSFGIKKGIELQYIPNGLLEWVIEVQSKAIRIQWFDIDEDIIMFNTTRIPLRTQMYFES